MGTQRKTARKRLIQAAFQLFSEQGVNATTTRQVADLASVNEVTLFRQFGSKQGLLLAVLKEAEVLAQLESQFGRHASPKQDSEQALHEFMEGYWQTLEQLPELMRSVIGEAGQFSQDSRQALGEGIQQAHRFTTKYLRTIGSTTPSAVPMTEQMASLLTVLLLGYAVLEFTTEFHGLWPDRQSFFTDVVHWLLQPGFVPNQSLTTENLPEKDSPIINDLPAPIVRTILQAARKQGSQDYALVYVLFGAGLTPHEVTSLHRTSAVYDSQQHILQVLNPSRQVPLNQWIMGHRYGSYTSNPLTKWLKSRKDDHLAMFIDQNGDRLTESQVHQCWQTITADLLTPAGVAPGLEQARHTWCVEMLLRGLDNQGLSILTGLSPTAVEPYAQRARERATLERALRLDRQPSHEYGKVDPTTASS